MSKFEETETVRVLNMLFPGKENIFNDVLGWDPVHMVSHLRFQPDQEFIDDFYNTLSNSADEYAQKIFTKIKTDIDTTIYKYLKENAYDTSVPDELKIELDGTKFLFSFLEGAIYTVDKRFRTVYGSNFTYLPYLFYEDIKVVVEESDDCVDIEIYHRDNLVETHTLKPVPTENTPLSCDTANRIQALDSNGEDEDSDLDSVEEYREATELHTKIISDFFSRKRIFRDKFDSDGIITKMSLPEDVKQRIFAKFDDLSDRFTDKYGGVRSFLPYQYIFFKLLLEEGYEYPLLDEEYPYRYTEAKYKAMEELYWSVKDPKDYSNFINFLKSPTECENFEIYDTPKKVVIQRSLSRGNTTAYVLTVKGDFDLALQYFTKVLPKSGKNPEYRYNLFILEMEDKLKLETISLNDVINYMISYVINELMYFAVEL